MFPLYEIDQKAHDLNNEAREVLSALISESPLKGDSTVISQGEVLFPGGKASTSCLYLVTSGFLKFSINDKLMFFFEAGDLIGFGNFLLTENTKIFTDMRTELSRFSREEFLETIATSPALARLWNSYSEKIASLYTMLLARLTPSELHTSLDTNFFWSGDPIVIQDTSPERVYTLLNGTADVYFGENRVGEVLTGEIFGAMAATSNSRASASVIARTPCLVMSLPKENFLTLAKTHPETLFKLIEDMSRIIVSQNEKIVALEEDKL